MNTPIAIRRTSAPRPACNVAGCHDRAPWRVTGGRVPWRVCESHARVLASRPGVMWDRTGEPARTMPGRSPLFHGGPFVGAPTITANPSRGRWRTRA